MNQLRKYNFSSERPVLSPSKKGRKIEKEPVTGRKKEEERRGEKKRKKGVSQEGPH